MGSFGHALPSGEWVIVVDAFSSGARYLALARARGLRVVHVQSSPNIATKIIGGFKGEAYDAAYVATPETQANLIEKLKALHPKAVLIGTETAVVFGNKLAESLGLPHNTEESSTILRDKVLMQKAFEKTGLYIPTALVSTFEGAMDWIRAHHVQFPVITKPRASAASELLRISKNPAELRSSIEEAIGRKDMFGAPIEQMVIQSFVDGQEYAINGVAYEGVIYVTDIWKYIKQMSAARSLLYDYDDLIDPQNTDVDIPAMIQYLEAALKAVDFQSGTFHCEMKSSSQGLRIIEIAGRPMGSNQPQLVQAATGTDQMSLYLDINISPQILKDLIAKQSIYQRQHAARLVELRSFRRGRIKSMPLYDFLYSGQLRTVLRDGIRWNMKVGDDIGPTANLFDNPVGGVMLMGPQDQVEADYAAIRSRERSGLVVDRPATPLQERWKCLKLLLNPRQWFQTLRTPAQIQ
jgi:biotin carboxylase